MDRLAIALLLAAMLGACGGRATTPPPGSDELVADLHGAGASFPAPIYMEWITDFQADNPGVRTNYQSKGSSAGREQFIAGQVHFGASDAPMKDAEVEAAEAARGCPPLHIPTLFGGVALAYNLPAVEQLVLDGETIAGIALGDIVSADDPRIAALNPGVELPGQRLTFV
ncbi:MAG TPA: phosphate ABC transporter substrate-binding protein PstS, partial [Candidatus Limnocylindria bacterium]|nr:phosphate ABC transporter substrate-binding protein PstS [Candidatus Limnocylindria bacterium]